jgi:hypothetical protein
VVVVVVVVVVLVLAIDFVLVSCCDTI